MKTFALAALLLLGSMLHAQIPVSLNVTPFTDFNYEDVEPVHDYDFDYPVYADILSADTSSYSPSYSDRYFMSVYGPRHKEVSTSNIGYFDFHKGSDMTSDVTYGGVTYDENTPPEIHCMCDGEVYEIFTGPDPESTGTGMYVTVKCDSNFQANPDWGNIYTAYRHLDSITAGLMVGDTLSKGDVVGLMGASGHTSTVHLHFSVIRRNTGSQINVHPMRLFNPDSIPHLVNHLTTAEITQLEHQSDEALFRLSVPYNMANIRAIQVSLPDSAYLKTYDFETVSILPEEDRDDNDAVDGLELFVYPFNRGHNAYRRVWDRYDDGQITTDYPACPDLGAGHFYPFMHEGLHQTPAYVLDLRVKDLPANYDITDLNIQVIDIWGYGVEANGVEQDTTEHFAWAMITDEDDDSEEYENGTIDLSSSDLDLVYDGSSHGNQTVGLLFRDMAIPNSSTITKARLQFRADATHSDPVNLYVKVEDTGSSADFSSDADDLSDRDTTYASLHWEPAAWTIDDMGDDQKCAGLEDAVQEVVTRGDWSTTSPLTFLITGSGRREAEGYSSSDLWKNAYVYIEYNDSTATAPNEPPTITLDAPLDGATYYEADTITLSATADDTNGNLSDVEFFVDGVSVGSVTSGPFELDWIIPDFGSYSIQAVATDLEGLAAYSSVATISLLDQVLDVQISDKNDDVEELENGTIWKTNSDLELCYDDYISNSQGLVGHQHVGLRFQNVTVPQGATITNAYIQFTADETDGDATEIIIRAEQVDDAAEFSYSTNNVSTRTMTADSVTWNPPTWNTVGAAGTDERTPDISALLQSVVDSSGWSSGNSMVLILYSWDQLKRVAESYDGSANDAAVLHIEFATSVSHNMIINSAKSVVNPSALRLFPNPVVSDLFFIEYADHDHVATHFQVMDMLGKVVAAGVTDGHVQKRIGVKTEDWPAGIYNVRVWSQDTLLGTKQVVVK
ncbi:MAG: Ig-like domain-containing protein [Bacteroidota bacterium]